MSNLSISYKGGDQRNSIETMRPPTDRELEHQDQQLLIRPSLMISDRNIHSPVEMSSSELSQTSKTNNERKQKAYGTAVFGPQSIRHYNFIIIL